MQHSALNHNQPNHSHQPSPTQPQNPIPSKRSRRNMMDIEPIYSPRTSYKQIKQNDDKMIADMTLNFDKVTIQLLKEEFLAKDNQLNLEEFIMIAKKHLKFWQVNTPNRDVALVRYLTYLFNEIDINGNGDMQWEEFTNYVIEKATVLKNLKSKADQVKHYVKSDFPIKAKIESCIQKMQYLPDIDKVAYFQEGSSKIQFFTLSTGQMFPKPLILDSKNLVVNISSVKKQKNGKVSIRKKDLVLPTNVRILDMLYIGDKKYKTLVVSTSDGYVRGWKYHQGNFIKAIQPDNEEELFEHSFNSEIYCLAWDGLNEILYCGQKNGNIYMWNLKTDLEKPLYENMQMQQSQEKTHYGFNSNSIENPNKFHHHNSSLDPSSGVSPQEKINCMITCMITMPKLQFMASGRMDGKLYLWNTIDNKKKWIYKQHTRGILTLAFNETMILLFSGGFDHKICIWNPYINTLIHKIQGHLSSILSLKVVQNSHQLISMDSEGIVKITDTKRFHIINSFAIDTTNEMGQVPASQQQITINNSTKKSTSTGISNVNCLLAINNPSLKLIFAGRALSLYEYDKNYNPDAADQNTVICCRYVKNLLCFFTPAGNKIKVWSALNGDVEKIYMDLTPNNQISTFQFDYLQKRMIIGDTKGHITIHNTVNGAKMKSLTKHNGEITHLISTVNENDNDIFISCAIDNEIKIVKETEESYEILRTICLRKDITVTCLEYLYEIKLIVVGTNLGLLVFYDLETGKNVGTVKMDNLMMNNGSSSNNMLMMMNPNSSGIIYHYQQQHTQHSNNTCSNSNSVFYANRDSNNGFVQPLHHIHQNNKHNKSKLIRKCSNTSSNSNTISINGNIVSGSNGINGSMKNSDGIIGSSNPSTPMTTFNSNHNGQNPTFTTVTTANNIGNSNPFSGTMTTTKSQFATNATNNEAITASSQQPFQSPQLQYTQTTSTAGSPQQGQQITSIIKTSTQPLLLITTSMGHITIIGLPPLPIRYQKIITFIHYDHQKQQPALNPTNQQQTLHPHMTQSSLGIRCSCFSKQQQKLFIVDDKMYITCYDLSTILTKMSETDYQKQKTQSERKQLIYQKVFENIEPFKKLWTIKAHNEVIKSIEYIEGENIVITSSYDKKVKIWNSTTGHYIDSLQQNYTKKEPQPIGFLDGKNKILYSSDKKKALANVNVDIKAKQFDPFYFNNMLLGGEASYQQSCSHPQKSQSKAAKDLQSEGGEIQQTKKFTTESISNKDWQVRINFKDLAENERTMFDELTEKLKKLQKIEEGDQEDEMRTKRQCREKLRKIQKDVAEKRQLLKDFNKQNGSGLAGASVLKGIARGSDYFQSQNSNTNKGAKTDIRKISTNYFKRSMMKCIQNFIDKNENNQLIESLKEQNKLSTKAQQKKRHDFIPIYKMIETNNQSQEDAKNHLKYIDELSRQETENMINSRKNQKVVMDRDGADKVRKLCRLLINTDRKDQRPKILMRSIEVKEKENDFVKGGSTQRDNNKEPRMSKSQRRLLPNLL